MLISSQFNRHFHGVTLKQIWEANIKMRICLGRYTRVIFPKGSDTDKWSFDEFKQYLKIFNIDYPKGAVNGKAISTKHITPMQLHYHVMWIESCCMDLPEYIREEIARDEILAWSQIETRHEDGY